MAPLTPNPNQSRNQGPNQSRNQGPNSRPGPGPKSSDGSPGSPAGGGSPAFDELFAASPMMAIFRGMTAQRSVALAERAWSLGLDCIEVPLQSEESREALEAVVAAGAARGKAVGAGTITTVERVEQAAEAGAAFTVAPGLDPEVARASRAAGMPHLPGVATATEVQRAQSLGLTWLKAFPATVLGTGWFRAMAGPFPGVPFVATGGIDAGNAADYLDAGARVVAVGSALEDPAQVDRLAELLAHRAATS